MVTKGSPANFGSCSQGICTSTIFGETEFMGNAKNYQNIYLRCDEEQHQELLTSEAQRSFPLSWTRRWPTARRTRAVGRSERADALGRPAADGRGHRVVAASGVVFLHVLDLVVPLQHVELEGKLSKPGQSGDPMSGSVPLVKIFSNLEERI